MDNVMITNCCCDLFMHKDMASPFWNCIEHGKMAKLDIEELIERIAKSFQITRSEAYDMAHDYNTRLILEHRKRGEEYFSEDYFYADLYNKFIDNKIVAV